MWDPAPDHRGQERGTQRHRGTTDTSDDLNAVEEAMTWATRLLAMTAVLTAGSTVWADSSEESSDVPVATQVDGNAQVTAASRVLGRYPAGRMPASTRCCSYICRLVSAAVAKMLLMSSRVDSRLARAGRAGGVSVAQMPQSRRHGLARRLRSWSPRHWLDAST